MVHISFEKLKNSPQLISEVRWDVTPKIFLDPSSAPGDEPADISYGYMLYVDLIQGKPALLIMQLKPIMSKTVGFVHDIPEDLLKDAMNCEDGECIAGMYPLSEKLEAWLKQELNVS